MASTSNKTFLSYAKHLPEENDPGCSANSVEHLHKGVQWASPSQRLGTVTQPQNISIPIDVEVNNCSQNSQECQVTKKAKD